jgi:type VI secretion system protein ImpA
MVLSDINSLLEPISVDAPCGIDLENSAIAELDRLAQGKPEQQIGSTVVPAEEPDWRLVQRDALQILARSKDLRAATQLARALLHTDSWAGFARGLAILAGIVERYWDGLYPLLDAEDDKDPTMRVNILMSVADSTVLGAVRATTLVTSRTLGRFSLRDIDGAAGEGTNSETNGKGSVTTASIEAAAMDCELDVLQQAASSVRDCVSGLTNLETALASHVEAAKAPSFAKLAAIMHKADVFLGSMVTKRLPATGAVSGVVAGAHGGFSGGLTGGIGSREDVLRALEGISAYYAKNEPSSPIPIFMARCKRLVMMDFVDIVRELVPDAISQVDVLRGRVE